MSSSRDAPPPTSLMRRMRQPAGAIDQLVVDLDAVIPGLVSDVDGSVTYSTSDDAETYSVVDEVARRALCTGARVLGARREDLPGRAPLIAILHYRFG